MLRDHHNKKSTIKIFGRLIDSVDELGWTTLLVQFHTFHSRCWIWPKGSLLPEQEPNILFWFRGSATSFLLIPFDEFHFSRRHFGFNFPFGFLTSQRVRRGLTPPPPPSACHQTCFHLHASISHIPVFALHLRLWRGSFCLRRLCRPFMSASRFLCGFSFRCPWPAGLHKLRVRRTLNEVQQLWDSTNLLLNFVKQQTVWQIHHHSSFYITLILLLHLFQHTLVCLNFLWPLKWPKMFRKMLNSDLVLRRVRSEFFFLSSNF